jgi:hypothetical protein
MSDDIDFTEANQALHASRRQQPRGSGAFDPVAEVETLVSSLLTNRINKITSDSYEEALKEQILARMPEATFSELISALANFQLNSNISLEKLLAPFLPRAGDRVPLLDKNKEEEAEKKVSDISAGASKDVLQALSELPKLLETLTKSKELSEVSEGDIIKSALKGSLEPKKDN